jgi:hypothetical protein
MAAMCQLGGKSSGEAWAISSRMIAAAERSKVCMNAASFREVTASRRSPHFRWKSPDSWERAADASARQLGGKSSGVT